MRIGRIEESVLSILLSKGAKTSCELAKQIKNIDLSDGHNSTKKDAFFRTVKQLKVKGLIVAKPHFKYENGFCGYMRNRFWAEGTYWTYYRGSGFFREKTRMHRYGFYHIYGLTSEGKKQLTKRRE